MDTRDISTLKLWDKNPRSITTADFERLKRQIKKLGQYKPLIITEDGTVLGGNMRLRAYQELGMKDVWVSIVKADTEQKKTEYALSDNDRAGFYDEDRLAELVSGLPELDIKDYRVDLGKMTSLEDLLDQYRPTTEDDAPEIDETVTYSKEGEIYQLGNHRLLCGDSTKPDNLIKLMAGKKADMVFTDPPYNVDYQGSMNTHGQNKREGIKNDNMSDEAFYNFLYDSFVGMMAVCNGVFYVCMSSKEMPNLKKAFDNAGGHNQTFIMWVKNTFTLSRSDYQNQYEPILYGWNDKCVNHYFYGYRNISNVWEEVPNKIKYEDGKTTLKIGGVKLEFDGKVTGRMMVRKHKTDIWRFDKPSRSEEHPTMKPVKLVAQALLNSSVAGQIILDPFLGSGSTLIAAEQTQRICYGAELDCKYADVIRKRYAKFIGKEDEWQTLTPRL